MNLLRIEASGPTTSFRYPFFMMGRHPTFPMPPPATIYGHICSALGEWVEPRGIHFGYRFTYSSSSVDLEHIHLVSNSTGSFEFGGQRFPKRAEGAVNPFKRDILFKPELVLYLDRPQWLGAFRNPRYTVVLGRSQDLFSYTDVRIIEAPDDSAYLEHTLLPFGYSGTSRGTSVVMPRFIHSERGREVDFAPYLVQSQRILAAARMPVDPDSRAVVDADGTSRRRGIVLHTFVD